MSQPANPDPAKTSQYQEIPFFKPDIGPEEIGAVVKVMRSGWLTTGGECQAFEKELEEYCERGERVLTTSSATHAADILFEILIKRAGNPEIPEIIFPAMTFSSIPMSAARAGFSIRFVDVDENMNMDSVDLSKALSERTVAVFLTHYGGREVNRPLIDEVLKDHWDKHQIDVLILEDASHCSPVQKLHFGDARIYSFYANKTMTTGEGGALVVPEFLLEPAKALRLHGFSRDAFDRYTDKRASWDYDVQDTGFKANMTDMAAAIGRVQLGKAYKTLSQRKSIAEQYRFLLEGEQSTEGARRLLLPPKGESSWHLYPIRVSALRRDQIIENLKDRGVHCSVHWRPCHLHTFWSNYLDAYAAMTGHDQREDLSYVTEKWEELISLPIWPGMTEDQVAYVTDQLLNVIHEQ